MKKVRRFNGEDDSYVEGTASSKADDVNDQLRQDQTERMARMATGENGNAPAAPTSRSMAPVAAEAPAAPAAAPVAAAEAPAAKSEGFGSAFSKARAKALEGGPSTFVWAGDGKRYGTDLAKPAASTSPSSPPAAAPKADTPKADTPVERGLPAKSSKEQSLAAAQIPLDDKRTPVKGESASGSELGRNVSNTLSALPISRGIQAVQSGAKLAGRKAVEEFVRKEPIYREPKLEILKDISKPLALPKPTPRLGYDKAGAKAAERGVRAAEQRSEMLKENARRSGLREDASAETSKAVRDKLGGNKFKIMKKGGSVKGYASGGSVSSASKRADGCAIRGKTRA